MRRLTRVRQDEDGAVVVLMVAAVVVIVGMAALVIDVGAILDEKRQLQNGADAAALAVAQSCGAGACNPSLAQALANGNARDARAGIAPPVIDLANRQVTVRTSTVEGSGSNILPYNFGQVVTGTSGRTVEASATARWDGLRRATVSPLTVSKCEFDRATTNNTMFGVPSVVYFHSKASPCAGPSGTDHPGGFGWLEDNNDSNNSDCSITPSANDLIELDTGVIGTPGACNATFSTLLGDDILLPIYDNLTGGTGGNGIYHIYGFAQFHLGGYYFTNSRKGGTVSCGSPDTCITGHFVKFVGTGEYGGPNLGNRVTLGS